MIREWVGHVLKQRNLSRQDFLSHLDTIVLNQLKRLLGKREMPSIMRKETAQEGYRAPFGDHPLLGHIAIYSLNLILLRVIVGDSPFVFDENQIATHEDGARPWDRLMHIWHSWFALDNLNGVTAVILADREGTQIRIHAKDRLQVAESQNRLETCLSVAVALGDNISSGLTGLLLFDLSRDNRLSLEEISERLASEKLDLDFEIAMKRLFQSERRVGVEGGDGFAKIFCQTLEMAIRGDKHEELEHISLSLQRGIRRLMRGKSRRSHVVREGFEVFRNAVDPKMASEVAMRNPQAVIVLWQVAKEVADARWRYGFGNELLERTFRRNQPVEMIERDPEAAITWLQLVREMGGGRFFEYFGRKFAPAEEVFERVLDPRYLFELIERNPEAALAWLQLAREMGGGRFLDRLRRKSPQSEKVLERVLDPHYLLELSERNPETALAWLHLARQIGGRRFFEYLDRKSLQTEQVFERIFDSRYLLELSERNPDVALAWLQVAREIGGRRFLEYFGRKSPHSEKVFERVLDPRYLLELSERNPKAALAWLQLAREVGGGQFLEYLRLAPPHSEETFGRVLEPRYLLELSERNPEVALAWLQLAREIGSGRFFEFLDRKSPHSEQFLERVLDPRYLFRLGERNPEIALAWLELAREMGGGRFFEYFGEEKWERFLSSFEFSRLLDRKPAVFAVALSLARNIPSPRSIDIVLNQLLRPLHGPDGGRSILGTLPLAALNDLRWLANKTNDSALTAVLDSWLRPDMSSLA